MVIQWSDEDQVFMVTLPEFDNAKTHGQTRIQAVRQGQDLIESFILWYGQDNKPLPEPRKYAEPVLMA
jgi:predicted RNase H-like HicB family nuclease